LPLLHYKAKAQQISSIKSSGLLLGLFNDGNFDEREIALENGDRLLIFTDGMIDFAVETGKRSDYSLFSETLLPYLMKQDAFRLIKEELFKNGLDTQVDDRSIISLYKIEDDKSI